MTAPTGPVADGSPRWGLGDVAAGWLLALFGGMVTATVVLVASGKEPDQADELSLGLQVLAQTGMWAAFLAVPWLVSQLKGQGMVADFGLRARLEDGPVGALVGLASQLILIPLVYLPVFLMGWLDTEELEKPARELTDRATGGFSVAMLILIVGVGAPIFEEIFYRGLTLRALENRFGPGWAVVGSGALFGASHFNAPLSIPGLVVFGIVLGLLTLRTGRLGPAIAAHVVFNMVTVVQLLLE